MNQAMLKKEKEKAQQRLDYLEALTTAPLRYIEFVKKHGTALKQAKIKAA